MNAETFWILLGSAVLILVIFIVHKALDRRLQISEYSLFFDSLDPEFEGFRIAQVSDLHGNDIEDLEKSIKKFKPDLIACTGDLYDGVRNKELTTQLLCALEQTAPVYFVFGNHEYYLRGLEDELEKLEKAGIRILRNTCVPIKKGSAVLELCGIDDPDLNHTWSFERRLLQLSDHLFELPKPKKSFRILLSHRADLFEYHAVSDADLILSGHLHGGHWRFFGRGMIAPNDGNGVSLFPRYDSGTFLYNGMTLVVSRGLGDQLSVPRLFNRPELVEIILKKSEGQSVGNKKKKG